MKNYSSLKTDFIVDNIKGFLTGKVLDVGCNEGIVADRLDLNNKQYVGIDIDDLALKEVRNKGFVSKKVDLSKENLPFEKNEFDSFLCLDILEHLQNPKKIIREINRVIKKDGRGIVALPNDLNLTNLLKVLSLGRSIVTRNTLWSPFGHLHFASVKESICLVKKYFKVSKIYFVPSKYTVPLLPNKIKYFLAKISPRLFCQNIIFEVRNEK